jgi:hypothetical protein
MAIPSGKERGFGKLDKLMSEIEKSRVRIRVRSEKREKPEGCDDQGRQDEPN